MNKIVNLMFLLVLSISLRGLTGFSLSDPVWLTAHPVYHGISGFSHSAPTWATTRFHSFHMAYSDTISVSTHEQYSMYRIVELPQISNPAVIEIPKNGYGYVWYRIEGYQAGEWKPVQSATVEVIDAEGHVILCQTGVVPYRYLMNAISINDRGAFVVPIPANLVGNGNVGASEILRIVKVNEQQFDVGEQIVIHCQVRAYEYESIWGYRLYRNMGAGLTSGLFTASGFIGGGFGATLSCTLDNSSDVPQWSHLTLSRRADLFMGVEAQIGPPQLISLSQPEFSAAAQISYPYERTYSLQRDQITGVDALMAFYLLAEPAIAQVNTITALFLACIMEGLIMADPEDFLGITHVSDEVGVDMGANMSLSMPFLSNLPLNLQATAGLGASSHIGATTKLFNTGLRNNSLYGESELSFNLGLQPIRSLSGAGAFYPQKISGAFDFNLGNTGYEYITTRFNNSWISERHISKLLNPSNSWRLYNMPLSTRYSTWYEVNNHATRNLLYNSSPTTQNVSQLHSSGLSSSITNSGFSTEMISFLDNLSQLQHDGSPLSADYGVDASVSNTMNFGLNLAFPLPNAPAVVIN